MLAKEKTHWLHSECGKLATLTFIGNIDIYILFSHLKVLPSFLGGGTGKKIFFWDGLITMLFPVAYVNASLNIEYFQEDIAGDIWLRVFKWKQLLQSPKFSPGVHILVVSMAVLLYLVRHSQVGKAMVAY